VLFFGESGNRLSIIVAVVAASPIRVTVRRAKRPDLPAGFGDVDLAILEWIAVESRPVRLWSTLH
jgi:hypothetical protein